MAQVGRQPWLDGLNPQQLEAVTHGEGPLLVVAGAGSGKTRTLASRVAHLISRGVPAGRILLVTFTRRASVEMLDRAAQAAPAARQVWGGTFHSIANRLLRMYSASIGLSSDFTIIDQSDAEDFVDVVRNDLGLSTKESRFPRKSTCLSIYSRRVNGQLDLGGVLKKEYPWCQMWEEELKGLFREYVERKQKQSVLDYDDLLLYLYYLLQDAALAESIGGRFDHILVDEYQDTNKLQAGILLAMRRQNRNIMVVGDDAQSIYGFRSASIRNMLDFPAQFAGAKVVTMEQNYRSIKPILETTNLVIAQAVERYSKELWSARSGGQRPQLITCLDEDEQADAVVDLVLGHLEQGIPLRKQAVLFRAASHSASLELALARRNVPFHKYGGLKFLEAGHVKDIISVLRIAENPRDRTAWFRVLRLLPGVGPVTAGSAFEHVAGANFSPVAMRTFKAPSAATEAVEALAILIEDLARAGDEEPALQIERILAFYKPLAERIYDDAEPRLEDIEHLGVMARSARSRTQFLADLILDPPASTGDLAGPPLKDEDWLVLSTIHSAKGLEWDAVYLIHAADGCLPSDMATGSEEEIAEELRLAYVAMTRARDFLYVLWPLRYYHKSAGISDRHSYAQRSRFFTDEVVNTMDSVSALQFGRHAQDTPVNIVGEDIGIRIRDMWK
jgi:DNA helicase-2/ATP-dependent DNA helicase PcrA